MTQRPGMTQLLDQHHPFRAAPPPHPLPHQTQVTSALRCVSRAGTGQLDAQVALCQPRSRGLCLQGPPYHLAMEQPSPHPLGRGLGMQQQQQVSRRGVVDGVGQVGWGGVGSFQGFGWVPGVFCGVGQGYGWGLVAGVWVESGGSLTAAGTGELALGALCWWLSPFLLGAHRLKCKGCTSGSCVGLWQVRCKRNQPSA
jgi:hypothetical protein